MGPKDLARHLWTLLRLLDSMLPSMALHIGELCFVELSCSHPFLTLYLALRESLANLPTQVRLLLLYPVIFLLTYVGDS